MNMELTRFLRHAIVPVVAYGVGAGWIPAEHQSHYIEATAMGGSFLATVYISKRRDGNSKDGAGASNV